MTINVEATRDFYQRLKQCCLTIDELANLPSKDPHESYLPTALGHGVGNDEAYFHKMVDRARKELVAASEIVARIHRHVEEFEAPEFEAIRASVDEMYFRPIDELDFDEEQTLSAATQAIQTARRVVSLFDAPNKSENDDLEGKLEFAKSYVERYNALFNIVLKNDPRDLSFSVDLRPELIPTLIADIRQEFRDVMQRSNQPLSEDVRADFSKKDEVDKPNSKEDQALIGLLALECQKPVKDRNYNRVVREFLGCDRTNAENRLRICAATSAFTIQTNARTSI